MTKEQALNTARLFLLHIYEEDVNLCARICVAIKDENTGYLCKCFDEVIKLCESIKEGLKG